MSLGPNNDFEYLPDNKRKRLIQDFISSTVPDDISTLSTQERYLLDFALWYCGVSIRKIYSK